MARRSHFQLDHLMMRTFAALLAFALAASAAPVAEAPRLDDEESAVLAAVLPQVGTAEDALVVQERIPAIGHPGAEAGRAEDALADMETKTVESFVARNRAGGRVEGRFAAPWTLRLLTPERKAELWKDVSCEDGWKRFREAFPRARGMLEISRVGVNHDHTQALVFVGRTDDCAVGSGQLYEVEKFQGTWKVVAHVPVWES